MRNLRMTSLVALLAILQTILPAEVSNEVKTLALVALILRMNSY